MDNPAGPPPPPSLEFLLWSEGLDDVTVKAKGEARDGRWFRVEVSGVDWDGRRIDKWLPVADRVYRSLGVGDKI